jgi:hypothetical protein
VCGGQSWHRKGASPIYPFATMGICSSCLGRDRDRDSPSEVSFVLAPAWVVAVTNCRHLLGRELEIALRRCPCQSLWQLRGSRCWNNTSRSPRSPARDRGLAEGRSTNLKVRVFKLSLDALQEPYQFPAKNIVLRLICSGAVTSLIFSP